jgi:hypothetical protein
VNRDGLMSCLHTGEIPAIRPWQAITQLPDLGSKIRHVVVPCASSRPLSSLRRPSAVPTLRPRLNTTPSALIMPVPA